MQGDMSGDERSGRCHKDRKDAFPMARLSSP